MDIEIDLTLDCRVEESTDYFSGKRTKKIVIILGKRSDYSSYEIDRIYLTKEDLLKVLGQND